MRSDPFDLVGDVLDGQFRVDAFVGEGDLTVVYRGHHVGVDAPVAIKCLNLPETLDDALAYPLVLTFQESCRMHYRLARGNLGIAQTIASGMTVAPRTGVAVSYLVREWLEGESLASDLARRRAEGHKGRLLGETLALLENAFDAIAYAHAQGEAHLSINPRNLFLTRAESAAPARSIKVLDFGLAHSLGQFAPDAGADSNATGGLHLLLPAYAAPEQLDRTAGRPGPWTDVYALALIVLEVLSDRAVMEGSEFAAVLNRVLDWRSRPTPRGHGLVLPARIDAALARALSRAPDDRQKSAGDLWAELKRQAPRISPPVISAAIAQPTPNPPEPPPSPKGPTSVETVSLSFEQDVPPPLACEPAENAVVCPEPAPAADRVITVPPPRGGNVVAWMARAAMVLSAALAWAQGMRGRMRGRMPWLTAAAMRGAARLGALGIACRDLLATRVKGAVYVGAIGTVGIVSLALSLRRPSPHARPPDTAPAIASPATVAPPATVHEEPRATPVVEAQQPVARAPFDRRAAVRALDQQWRRVAKCRRARASGKAWTTIQFATDGSVANVTVDTPFAETPTGQCIAEALASVRMEPFADPPAPFAYRVYVAP
jgi:serine/threonine protein kinase